MPVKQKKRLRGVKRLMVHIILLGVLGTLAVALGIVGQGMLADLTEQTRDPERVKVIAAEAEASLKTIINGVTTDAADVKTINNGLSAKRRTVKNTVESQVGKGIADDAIAGAAMDIFMEGISAKLGEDSPTFAALRERMQSERGAAVARVADLAQATANAISVESVRMNMSVTSTPNYAVMFYGVTIMWIGFALLAICAVLTLLWIFRDEEGRRRVGAMLEPFDYLLPFFLGVAVFTLYPMVRVTVMSFQEKYQLGKNGFGSFTQWGLGNYEFVLKGVPGTQNVFMKGLSNTAVYVVLTVPIAAAVSILMAYLLNQKIKFNGLFQTGYFIPMVTSVTAVGLVWRWMFNTDFGFINAVFTGSKINWLANYPMTVLVIFGVWSSLPFTIILLLSGLQNIDENLYTVAKVDGSGAARIFFKITVPLLSPTIGLVLIINSISAFKVYTDVVVLWNGAPENFGMQTVTWYIYDQITTASDGTHYLGYAAAAAMVLFVIIFIFTMVQRVIQRKWVYQ